MLMVSCFHVMLQIYIKLFISKTFLIKKFDFSFEKIIKMSDERLLMR